MIDEAALTIALANCGLTPRGYTALSAEEQKTYGGKTVLLIGPDLESFWSKVQNSPRSTSENPMDEYARDALMDIAGELGLRAVFPFEKINGGFVPFFEWAIRSGEAFQSPVGMLVHQQVGMMISYRGGLILSDTRPGNERLAAPCQNCVDQPCKKACPVGALGKEHYDVGACRESLRTLDIGQCRNFGCAARRACPLSPKKAPRYVPHVMASFLSN